MAYWIEGFAVGVPVGNAKNACQIFAGTNTSPWPMIAMPQNQWITVDLHHGPQWGDTDRWQPNLPANMKAVFLSGELIITGDLSDPTTENLWMNFRSPGDSLQAGNYQSHTIAPNYFGSRSNCCVWVPVVGNKFEVYWNGD